jgi:hypothetical protein
LRERQVSPVIDHSRLSLPFCKRERRSRWRSDCLQLVSDEALLTGRELDIVVTLCKQRSLSPARLLIYYLLL